MRAADFSPAPIFDDEPDLPPACPHCGATSWPETVAATELSGVVVPEVGSAPIVLARLDAVRCVACRRLSLVLTEVSRLLKCGLGDAMAPAQRVLYPAPAETRPAPREGR